MPTQKDCANALRFLAIDAIEQAKSGHPGAPLGMADIAEVLFRHVMNYDPATPLWPNRDRFILSSGHASMLLYAALYLSGYDLTIDDIRNFRQLGSKTAGHPEKGLVDGVEMTTGPLGQGISSAVGMALAEKILASNFNTNDFNIIDHYTYVLCGDGCLMEGVSHEACSLAGTWKLGKLIVLYDSNDISIDGKVEGWFTEDVGKRYEAYGWQVIGPIDGHDSEQISNSIDKAKKDLDHPTLIICKTHIGFGSPKIDSESCHGAPLGEDAINKTRENLQWNFPHFIIPDNIKSDWDMSKKGQEIRFLWQKSFEKYASKYPEKANEFNRRINGDLPNDWTIKINQVIQEINKNSEDLATRQSSQKVLNSLVDMLPELLGGSADLTSSVGTFSKSSKHLDLKDFTGNYLSYGVREFGMATIMNGLALHGGFVPYGGTFMVFSDQAKNGIRLSAIMGTRLVWVLTHDSIGVGEDGATHQPIEQISSLRMIPNCHVWRPCDGVEVAVAWKCAMENKKNPTCLSLSRQKLSFVKRNDEQISAIARGGYILRDCIGEPDIIILATGSEVELGLQVIDNLNGTGVKARLVSMPCAEVFDEQDEDWKEKVLPKKVRCRLAIEAASKDYWYKYVGLDGSVLGMDSFGTSAKGSVIFDYYGFNLTNALLIAHNLLHAKEGEM